jgi:diadenylate cyclase
VNEFLRQITSAFASDWRAGVELALMIVIVYGVFRFMHGTRGAAVLRGTVFVGVTGLVALLAVAQIAGLVRLVWVLEWLLALGAIGVFILFQPEIRLGLIRLGRRSVVNLFARSKTGLVDGIVEGVVALAKQQRGALIAVQRDGDLGDFIEGGVKMEAYVSAELIVGLFAPQSPLHDGAAIIRAGRIAAAGCLLPLTDNPDISVSLGTRHRAGIGLTEQTDAVTIIVSEGTGRVSIGVRGELMQGLSAEDLREVLRKLCGQVDLEAKDSA